MYGDIFCRVYNELGWNYYPEAFGQQLLVWLEEQGREVKTALDLGCGTGVLCRILADRGIRARGMDLSPGMIAIAREAAPELVFEVGNMITYDPGQCFELVTCTGDALNHIPDLRDVETILKNVYGYLTPGGVFVFDILNEKEISDSEPFELYFDEKTRVRFQMICPERNTVHLNIRVWEEERLKCEEVIRETVHDPDEICRIMARCGFRNIRCAHGIGETGNQAATWFVTAEK